MLTAAKKQIPFGNDSKEGKDNGKGKGSAEELRRSYRYSLSIIFQVGQSWLFQVSQV